MASILLQNVGKKFGRVTVIENLNLSVCEGEFVTLLGPSGCGKSTLLNLVAGLEMCTSGSIHFAAQDVTALPPGNRDVAMVFQSYALYPHLTIFDNIAFPLAARHAPQEEIKKAVTKVAEKLELSHLLARLPRELSGGQRQRVALARALVRSPKVFLFDEPLSNLDAALKVSTRSEIKKLHQELGTTMLYVTHDQAEAMSLSDRIAIFSKGELQQFDTPDVIYHKPANLFVAAFVGSPAMNIWHGTVKERGVLELSGLSCAIPEHLPVQAGDRLSIGIRPHEFALVEQAGAHTLVAQVITMQPMGECNFLDLRVADQRAIVRTEAGVVAKPGTTVHLAYEPGRLHCFAASGKRVA